MKGQIKKRFTDVNMIRLDRTELRCANLLKSVAIVLLLIGITTSCTKEEKEVSFIKYASVSDLIGTCQFVKPFSVIIINDEEELEENLECSIVYPPIDFSKSTLLFVRGAAGTGASKIDVTRFHHVGKKYTIDITVYLDILGIYETWTFAMLVSKLPKGATINLNIDNKHY